VLEGFAAMQLAIRARCLGGSCDYDYAMTRISSTSLPATKERLELRLLGASEFYLTLAYGLNPELGNIQYVQYRNGICKPRELFSSDVQQVSLAGQLRWLNNTPNSLSLPFLHLHTKQSRSPLQRSLQCRNAHFYNSVRLIDRKNKQIQ
jgi:hypothetical protein